MCHSACMFSYIPPVYAMWRAYRLPLAHGSLGCSSRGSSRTAASPIGASKNVSVPLSKRHPPTLLPCLPAEDGSEQTPRLGRWLRSVSLARKRVNMPHGMFIYAMWRIHLTHAIRCNLSPATVRRRGSDAILPVGKRDFVARGWGAWQGLADRDTTLGGPKSMFFATRSGLICIRRSGSTH